MEPITANAGVVLGLSGGIDSAICAAIAVDALVIGQAGAGTG